MLERKQLKGRTQVTFVLLEDTPCGPVSVVGDFNHWNPAAHPLGLPPGGAPQLAGAFPAAHSSNPS